MSLVLEPLGTLTLHHKEGTLLACGPTGTRVFAEFHAIEWTGARVHARLRGHAAGDWITVGTDGTSSLDMRFLVETHDGAVLFVEATGRCDVAPGPGVMPSYIAPRFETSDERYAWLNKVLAVGKGKVEPQRVTFELYELR